eukprot:2347560-Pleurochrysis_carterae.AAC.1
MPALGGEALGLERERLRVHVAEEVGQVGLAHHQRAFRMAHKERNDDGHYHSDGGGDDLDGGGGGGGGDGGVDGGNGSDSGDGRFVVYNANAHDGGSSGSNCIPSNGNCGKKG